MEVKDKVVTVEGLKGVYDNLNGKISSNDTDISNLQSSVAQLNSELRAQTFSIAPGIYNTISNYRGMAKQKRILMSFEISLNEGKYDNNPYVCATVPKEYAPKSITPVLSYGTKNSDGSRYIAMTYPDGGIRIVINKEITAKNNTIMFGVMYDID